MRMKRKHSKLKPLSQNSILSNRGSWRSKKFAHIPMEMPTVTVGGAVLTTNSVIGG